MEVDEFDISYHMVRSEVLMEFLLSTDGYDDTLADILSYMLILTENENYTQIVYFLIQ